MNFSDIINNASTAIILGAIGVIIQFLTPYAVATYKRLIEKLPSSQRAVLWDYTNTVVKSIAQQFADWTPERKKSYAVQEIQKLLGKADIDLPDELISHVIEQVVFEVKEAQKALK